MPFVNLIAEQRLEHKRAERRNRIAFSVFAAITAASVGGFGFLLFMTQVAHSDVERMNAQIERLKPIRKEIAANQAALRELSPRLTTLEDAQAATARWSRILDFVAQQTPQSMWLTQLRATTGDPTQPITASFQGISGHLEPVGEFILRLQNSPDLQAVSLKFASEKVLQQGRGIEFEVTANVAGTAEKPAKKTPEDAA